MHPQPIIQDLPDIGRPFIHAKYNTRVASMAAAASKDSLRLAGISRVVHATAASGSGQPQDCP